MNLHELDLPSEVTHLIRLFVGPHPCAKMVRDFLEDIEYDENERDCYSWSMLIIIRSGRLGYAFSAYTKR